MISYKPLFKTLIDKNVNLSDLVNANVNSAIVAKFKKNKHVNTSTLEKICLYLHCRVEDVIEILPDAPSAPEQSRPDK